MRQRRDAVEEDERQRDDQREDVRGHQDRPLRDVSDHTKCGELQHDERERERALETDLQLGSAERDQREGSRREEPRGVEPRRDAHEVLDREVEDAGVQARE